LKPEKKRRNIVARIMAAENKSAAVAAEAKRAGVSTRTIERWVEAANAFPIVGQPVVSETVPTPLKPAENPVLDTLLKEEGAAAGGPSGPPTPLEIQQAGVDAENFCVDSYASARSAVGSLLVSINYTPPLDATSPEVLSMLKMGDAAELAIRANAPKLYPILMRYASNWGALVVVLAADAFGMIKGLEGLAKSRGWVPKERGQKGRPAPVPSAQTYGESLRPQTQTASASNPENEKAKATIVDAPVPSSEQVEMANAVRAALVS
jgi:hypothetical protein